MNNDMNNEQLLVGMKLWLCVLAITLIGSCCIISDYNESSVAKTAMENGYIQKMKGTNKYWVKSTKEKE